MSGSGTGASVRARRVFIATAILWPALLVVVPLAATRSAPGQLWYAVACGVYGLGRFICHQMPERSFSLWTAQMPVCARCTGIYVGGAIAAIVAARRMRSRPGVSSGMDRLGSDSRLARIVVTAAALPTAATLVFEWTTAMRPLNIVRAMSGAPLGAAIVLIIAAALAVGVPLPLAPVPAGRKVN